MLLWNHDVFDEVITGTTTIWYSASTFNALLGSADRLVVLAYPTGLVSSPSLNAYVESSSDNQHWAIPATLLWAGQVLAEGAVLRAQANNQLAFNRLKITLGGSSTSQCRLKVTVTGRAV